MVAAALAAALATWEDSAGSAPGDSLPPASPGMTIRSAAQAGDAPPAPPPGIYRIRPGESELVYEVHHPLHEVRGVSRDVRGELALTSEAPYLRLPARLSTPLSSFGSGNRNRDSNALSALSASRFPEAIVEIRRLDLERAERSGYWEARGLAEGEVTLRGVGRPFRADVLAQLGEAGKLLVRARFGLSLTAHRVERPSLLFMPVDDRVDIRCRLVGERQ